MRLVDVETGKVLKKTSLDRQWFGEGTTRLGDQLYQITWLTNQGFIYSVPDLKQVCSAAVQEMPAQLRRTLACALSIRRAVLRCLDTAVRLCPA